MGHVLLFLSEFELWQILPLCAALVLAGAAVFLLWYRPYFNQSILLFFAAFCTAFFIGSADPFLHIWDEQFHALVAKNMLSSPLKPVLYADPVLDYDFQRWDKNHVWLHKQPLFLWQIMLSIGVFGDTVFAVRFPSMILFAGCVVFTYKMGVLFVNKRVGVFAAVFFCFSFFPLQVLAGRYPTDHNDISFLFYITASLWSWAAYSQSGKRRFLYLLAFFAAGAVLTKWLTGLLVYGVWAVSEFAKFPNKIFFKKKLPLIMKFFAVTAALVIPWQVYTLVRFPLEAKYELGYNGKHFFNAVEGHSGGAMYHIDQMELIYRLGPQSPIILLLGLVIFLVRTRNRSYRFGLAAAVVTVYVFFTLAATKMPCFTLPLFSIGMLSLASLIVVPAEFIAARAGKAAHILPVFTTLIAVYVGYRVFHYEEVRRRHTDYEYDHNFNYPQQMKQMKLVEEVNKQLNDVEKKYVLFNADARYAGYIAVMFFTDITAYGEMPSTEDLARVKERGYTPVICTDTTADFAVPEGVLLLQY